MKRLITALLVLVIASVSSAQSESSLGGLDRDLRRLAARATPAVVRVIASRTVVIDARRADGVWTYVAPVDTTTGSGFVVAKNRVVTSSHVVAGARDFTIVFADGRHASARVLGTDDFYPVALLEVETEKIEALVPTKTARAEVGGLAVVFGNPVDGGGAPMLAMTGGTRRARGDFDNYFVVSAPLLPGGSGGPVLSPDGSVIGLAHSSFGDRFGASAQGAAAPRVSYCVPAGDLAYAIAQIGEHGRVRRAWLGVGLVGATSRIESVVDSGPAAAAGLLPGDELVSVAGTATPHEAALVRSLARLRPGASVELKVRRAKTVRALVATLVERSSPPREDVFEVVPQGVRLTDVSRLSPVNWLRLRKNDVIEAIDGRTIHRIEEVRKALAQMEKFRPVHVRVLRLYEDSKDASTISIYFGGKLTLLSNERSPKVGGDGAEKDD